MRLARLSPAKPEVIARLEARSLPLGGGAHGLSISDDGNRAYVVSTGSAALAPDTTPRNGFHIIDVSEVQARKANPQMRVISQVAFRDGTTAQHTVPIAISGKPYLVMVDEAGAGGLQDSAGNAVKNACAAGLSPFPMARIFDISDEKNPTLVSKLMLETHDPANCDKVLPDVIGLTTFTYGSHYCSVDNRQNATALACAYFNSGVRVFDIRNPARPREIAYFNPAGSLTRMNGSTHSAQWFPGSPDWCAARMDFDYERGLLVTMCQDNGLLVMKFKNGVWPMPQSTPSPNQH